jgi:site-specific DNA recombinase
MTAERNDGTHMAETFREAANGRKRAVIVARVSSKQQEGNYSLSSQLDAMRRYGAEHGFDIVEEIRDVISGAVEIRERPGGSRLYELIDSRAMDAVLFYTIDRVARDEDVAEFIILKRDLRRAGIELHFYDDGMSDGSALGGIVEYIKASYAAEERKKIRERVMRGVHAKAATQPVCGGNVCFGYRREGRRREARFVINESEAATVQRIFADFIGVYGDPPKPMLAIARELTAEGIQPPRRPNGIQATRGWWAQTIHTILTRRAYIGESRYAGHVLQVPELAVIPQEWFDAAQERIEKNKRLAGRNKKRQYLLAGHIRCQCGASMTGTGWGEVRYYRCYNSARVRHLSSCREKVLRADLAEAVVWRWIAGLLGDEANLRRKAEQDKAANQDKADRLVTLRELVTETEAEVKGLIADLAELSDASAKTRATLRAALRDKDRLLTRLTSERNRLAAEVERLELTPDDEARIVEEAALIRANMERANFETRRFWLDRLDFQCHYRRDAAGRWLDVSCALITEPQAQELERGTFPLRESLHRRRVIIFSDCLPLDGQPIGDGLANALFNTAGRPAEVLRG